MYCVYLSAQKCVTIEYRNYNKEQTEIVKTIATSNIYVFNDFSRDAIYIARRTYITLGGQVARMTAI